MNTVSINIRITKGFKTMSEYFASHAYSADIFKSYANYTDRWVGEVYEDRTLNVTEDIAERINEAFWEFTDSEEFFAYGNEINFSLSANNKKEAAKIYKNMFNTIHRFIVESEEEKEEAK